MRSELSQNFFTTFILFCLTAASSLYLTACSSDGPNLAYSPQEALEFKDVHTGLPKVVIITPHEQEITSKSQWMADAEMTVFDVNGQISYHGSLSIKGRGNSTWGFPKKPYALKLNKKSELLGMAKHKRWCLLANWIDRTMMRNDIAFEIARHMSALAYTPHGEFVELFLNGRHLGNYYLCEQIKVDENRVNIAELDEGTTTGADITGGFLMEVDAHFDEDFRFISERYQLPWQCKDPDEVNEAQFGYIRQFVAEMEDALYDERRFAARDFTRYMDLDTFADWWIVHELTMNSEPRFPYSCLMHKDIDANGEMAKMKAGPVWDFDYNTFIPEYSCQFSSFYLYYPRLFQDQAFRNIVKERWQKAKDASLLVHIDNYIKQVERQLEASDRLNAAMWPTTNNINGDTYLGFHDAVERLRLSFSRKYAWLDNTIEHL